MAARKQHLYLSFINHLLVSPAVLQIDLNRLQSEPA